MKNKILPILLLLTLISCRSIPSTPTKYIEVNGITHGLIPYKMSLDGTVYRLQYFDAYMCDSIIYNRKNQIICQIK